MGVGGRIFTGFFGKGHGYELVEKDLGQRLRLIHGAQFIGMDVPVAISARLTMRGLVSTVASASFCSILSRAFSQRADRCGSK